MSWKRKLAIAVLALTVIGLISFVMWLAFNSEMEETHGVQTVAETTVNEGTSAYIALEVAPNPDNKEATAEWEALTKERQYDVSVGVLKEVIPLVLNEYGATGSWIPQVGAYEGYVNPSFSLKVEENDLVIPVTKALGFVLKQKGMFVTTTAKIDGVYEQGAVYIKVPAGFDRAELKKMCTTFWETRLPTGIPLATGFSFRGDELEIIHNDLSDAEAAAAAIREILGEEFSVRSSTAYALYLEVDGVDENGAPVKDYGVGDNVRLNQIRTEAEGILARVLHETGSGN